MTRRFEATRHGDDQRDGTKSGAVKSILLFLAGVLVGANVVYFLGERPSLTRAPGALPAPMTQPHAAPPITPVAQGERARDTQTPAATTSTSPPPDRIVNAPKPATVDGQDVATAAEPAAALLMPVQDITIDQISDTFNDTRGSDRRHEAQDIMAARGTPVLATNDGTIEKLFTSKLGGLTIYQFDPSRTRTYYYAHLDRYAKGLSEGDQIHRGEVIGYVGSTGNANPDAPHLHFAIFVLGPEKQWWKGTPVNPYPLLSGE